MQFADPQATSIAYLILRHLYDGDIIEWPVPEDHPQRAIFVGLETQGYVARWDRMWPLSDRYRLTEKGIALIESVYRPAGAEAFFDDVRRQNLSPNDRRAYLVSRRLDPVLWPLLHDPSTHWTTYGQAGSRYQQYIWEDERPAKRRRPPAGQKPVKPMVGGGGRGAVVHHHHHHHHHGPRHPHLVDLDREADDAGVEPARPDYDVS
ncbi:MAG: hypothetical protein JST00_44555 [Deltaproteobacteria bacterium]|nr:hypothetical protein [Deltaproteobacteria bacterium]